MLRSASRSHAIPTASIASAILLTSGRNRCTISSIPRAIRVISLCDALSEDAPTSLIALTVKSPSPTRRSASINMRKGLKRWFNNTMIIAVSIAQASPATISILLRRRLLAAVISRSSASAMIIQSQGTNVLYAAIRSLPVSADVYWVSPSPRSSISANIGLPFRSITPRKSVPCRVGCTSALPCVSPALRSSTIAAPLRPKLRPAILSFSASRPSVKSNPTNKMPITAPSSPLIGVYWVM